MATMTCSIVHSRKIPKIANFWTCSSVPPSVCLYINPPSLLYSSRKPPAWLWETASCLLRKKEKEIFPQAGCLLDKVFCLCTQSQEPGGAAEKAFALKHATKLLKLGIHALICIKTCYCFYSQHIEMSVFCIMPSLLYCTEEIMSFPSSTFSRAF